MLVLRNKHILLAAGLLLLALHCAAQRRNPLPVPDISGYKTLKCDLHMHTVHLSEPHPT